MSKKDGGPAFPAVTDIAFESTTYTESGMTLRDYFAAAAMQGMLSNGSLLIGTGKTTAVRAYGYADAMITER